MTEIKLLRVLTVTGFLLLFSVGVGLIFFSGGGANADKSISQNAPSNLDKQHPVLVANKVFIEELRQAYAKIASIDMESVAWIKIYRDGHVISGEGNLRYVEADGKYRYEVTLSDNLKKAGLMRDLTFVWDGSRFYMHDPQVGVLSFQANEDKHLSAALPNPFFMPVEFFSSDDDECVNCRLKLKDLTNPAKWQERLDKLRVIESQSEDGLIHDFIKIPGGKIADETFDYNVRIVGHEGARRQINSIALTDPSGGNLLEMVFAKHSKLGDTDTMLPLETMILVRDKTGKIELTGEFRITRININQSIADEKFKIKPELPTKFWDSDRQEFVVDIASR